MVQPFEGDIIRQALENTYFRREIVTGEHTQVVVMSIPPGGEIGDEVHPNIDQVLLFVAGEGESILDGKHQQFSEHTLVFVPAGTRHNFVNRGTTDLKVVTVYGPPEHEPGTVHKTKAEADAAEAEEHAVSPGG